MIIGEEVKILKRGKHYPIFSEMFLKMGFKNIERNTIEDDNDIYLKYKIFNYRTQVRCNKDLIAIRNENGIEFLFEKKGIELVNAYKITIK